MGKNEENTRQEDENDPPGGRLHKQNSIFALTLDEIQCKSGRSFGSMNMEEFIANIWSVDDDDNNGDQGRRSSSSIVTANDPSVSRQGSFSIPVPLCKKTVDQIWFDLHKGDGAAASAAGRSDGQRQTLLGEMTLEDFLAKAGVVQEESNSNSSRISVPGINGPTAFSAYQVYGSHPNVGEASGRGKKRIIDGPPEVVVERRQRRMIKNRESAARSRARKQAYTVELEVELNQLKEENEKLKQVMAEAELKRKQEVLMKAKTYTTRAQKLTQKLRIMRRAASLAW